MRGFPGRYSTALSQGRVIVAPIIATQRDRSDAIIIVRRGIRSASAPPIRSVVSSPIAWARKTMPSRDEPTSVNARQPSAVKNAASPISETNCPGPQQAEIAVAERVEDAHALEGSGFDPPAKAIVAAWTTCRRRSSGGP